MREKKDRRGKEGGKEEGRRRGEGWREGGTKERKKKAKFLILPINFPQGNTKGKLALLLLMLLFCPSVVILFSCLNKEIILK